ncbi:MAG: adenylate kinase [Candidatus Heimdallarchaeota archaeon]|nr:adenylate kinase [Candidatus Heimdallarchaeota archaeon]
MVDQSNITIVGGVPGVGKTTVINYALEYAKQENFDVNIFVYGSIMMEIAKEEHNINHRDELRKLAPNIQKEIQRRAAKQITEQAINKVTLVDTHYTIKTGSSTFLQGIPSWVSDEFQPKLLVIIETNPQEIVERRSTDNSRIRDEETFDVLFEHQLINKTVASTICQKSGALLAVIKNREGQAEKAGKELFELLKNLK